MGLFTKLLASRRRQSVRPQTTVPHQKRRVRAVERLESRRLMAGDIHIGMVYYEPNDGADTVGNTLQVTWNGGQPGTQLTRLVIDTDKLGDGLTIGDTLFHTEPGGPGVFGWLPFTVLDSTGIDSVTATVDNGGTKLILDFTGFDSGEKLIFKIDVDEMGFLGANAVAEGNEFEGSKLTATFAAPHFYEATGTDIFFDAFDGKFAGLGLDLPGDNYAPPGTVPTPVYTAGAALTLAQTPLPIRVAGTVYEDVNSNNHQDPGEAGIGDVELSLWREDGGVYVPTGLTVVTDASGHYAFENVLPGRYRIVETQPSGYFSVGAKAGSVGGATRGVVSSADVISDIDLLGGDESINNDFAEARPVTLSGHVYHDADMNGMLDSGESGIGGVELALWKADGGSYVPTGLTVVTDALGHYAFENVLPGRYRIVETQPSGYFSVAAMAGNVGGATRGVVSSADVISDIDLFSGEVTVHNDFAEARPATLSGHVYHDANNNGVLDPGEILDPGESGIGGVVITIQQIPNSGPLPAAITVTTAADGTWIATGLMPGAYRITEAQPSGWLDGLDRAGTAGGTAHNPGDMIDGIVLASGQIGTDYDFGELLASSISGHVLADRNGNCEPDPGELLLAGVTIRLRDSQGNLIATTTTDQNGHYEFTGLAPGIYVVEEEQPQGYFDVAAHPGSADGIAGTNTISSIVLVSGTVATDYNFCEHEPVTISGFVYSDQNQNCQRDSGETGIAGVAIRLLDSQGNPTGLTTVTDASGAYHFSGLKPGTYGVAEVQPSGYFNGCVSVGTAGGIGDSQGDKITQITLAPAVHGENYNFGELLPAKISGYVFQDGGPIIAPAGASIDVFAFRNGLRGPDSTPIAGVELRLGDLAGEIVVGPDGQPLRAVTDANGYYEFAGLRPGFYTVFEVQPDGYYNGINTPGTTGGLVFQAGRGVRPEFLTLAQTGDAIVRILVTPGEFSRENNFAEVLVQSPLPPTQLPPPTLVAGLITIPSPAPTPAPVPVFFGLPPASPPILPTAPPIVNSTVYFGGLGYLESYTWHLSVINGGTPRGTPGASGPLVRKVSMQNGALTWSSTPMDQGKFTLQERATGRTRTINFGHRHGKPVTGDFNGDGVTEVGIFLDGEWFIDANGNGVWDEEDLWAELGSADDLPVTGDWDGDGKTDIGVFGPSWPGDERAIAAEPGIPDPENRTRHAPKNIPPQSHQATSGVRNLRKTSTGQVRSDLIDHVFSHGVPGDVPLTGDWNGDGIATIGLFSAGEWYLDMDGDGKLTKADQKFTYGLPTDVPVVGDFNGDGISEIGVYRDGVWYIDADRNRRLDAHDRAFQLGGPGQVPVVGDWDGDGRAEPGVYQPGASPAPSLEPSNAGG